MRKCQGPAGGGSPLGITGIAEAMSPGQQTQQSISSEHHRGRPEGENGRCQAIADQIYLLAHMGLSLGTP